MIGRNVVLGALATMLIGLCIGNGNVMAVNSYSESPIRGVVIAIKQGTRDKFFDQIRDFAKTYAFAIRISPIDPERPQFSIAMYREDIKILGANPFDELKFDLGFYQNSEHPVIPELLNHMVSDFKKAMKQVPGAEVTVE